MRRPSTAGEAAQWLQQRKVPDEYVREATANYSLPLQSRQRDGDSVLVFGIGAEWLALPTALFDEVVEPRKPHSLPMRRSGALLGVVNVRGELLACVSLAVLLGIDVQAGESGPGARMLVLHPPLGRRLACPVDSVHGVWTYGQTDLAGPPLTVNPAALRYTRALLQWQQHTIGLIDHGPLLQAVERSLA